ncbi:hypothetical protein PsorP6_013120 [Peronosclerospora sorghi]|uniref:Uncharacterized protein n=1 Tax=Peronosclerospora sorghi TaxID=230839 RepID=A0ACC0WG70_9STRA|nr:hypothetical protein PsorP6_013120 [Peronosclerospora sorghi]
MATLGARCELVPPGPSGSLRASIKRYGEIAYIGAVEGLPGDKWIGVRLDQPLGKGDGTYQGRRYFDCQPLHGAIVRPERVNVDGEFPVLTTHEASLAHALDERRKQRQGATSAGVVDAHGALSLHREHTNDELATKFWDQFTQREKYVRKQVNLFCEQKKQPVPCEPAKEVKLDALLLEVNAMRDAAATAASLYLSPYDTRQTQFILSRLLELVETTRSTFAPRKKFTFRVRAARKVQDQVPNDPEVQSQASASIDSAHNVQVLATREKWMELDDELVYANKENEVIIIDRSSLTDVDDQRCVLILSSLKHCVVFVGVETSAIHGEALEDCVVYIGAIHGSLWLESCTGCDFFAACRQLRVHSSTRTTFNLRISSHPIIEDCQQMQFGPYRLQFNGLEAQLERLNLQKDCGLWAKVNDFKWHKTQQSPHWSIRDSSEDLPKIPPELKDLVSYD